jgi:putative Ca2+/H+ antiporter (TMEM165/GDT1 family)
LSLAVLATVFGLVFIAELPDKTAIASLVLGAKYRASWVFTGVAAAFLLHVILAVLAGSLIALLPHRLVEAIVSALFLVGAVMLWFRGAEDEHDDVAVADQIGANAGFARVATVSFAVIFLAEFGDLTQILTANLAARYHAPLTVGIGATLGLWAVALFAILAGKTLLKVVPVTLIVRVAAAIMLGLAAYSLVNAVRG